MESYNEANAERYEFKPEENNSKILGDKMAELIKIKEELRRAKDSAMQSWLDSRPLIDELENQQSSLSIARNTSSVHLITDLKSQLETTNASIIDKKEEQHKTRLMIDEMTIKLDQTRHKIEELKHETDEERRARVKLKQVLRVKRQTLQTLKLTLRAIRLESEAFGASRAEALRQINLSEMDNATVQLTQEDYNILTKRAKEETSLADWRISVSMEQRLVAEAGRETALRRLKELKIDTRQKKWEMKGEKVPVNNEVQLSEINLQEPENTTITEPKWDKQQEPENTTITEPKWDKQQQPMRRSRRNRNKKLIKKNKPSMFYQIKRYIVRKLTRLFG